MSRRERARRHGGKRWSSRVSSRIWKYSRTVLGETPASPAILAENPAGRTPWPWETAAEATSTFPPCAAPTGNAAGASARSRRNPRRMDKRDVTPDYLDYREVGGKWLTDKLLLDLKGAMSEQELHWLSLRRATLFCRTASPFLQRPTPAVAPVTSKTQGEPCGAARTKAVTASSKSNPPANRFRPGSRASSGTRCAPAATARSPNRSRSHCRRAHRSVGVTVARPACEVVALNFSSRLRCCAAMARKRSRAKRWSTTGRG